MNAPLTVRSEPTSTAVRQQAEQTASKAMPEQRVARMSEVSRPADATPRYDFVGIAG